MEERTLLTELVRSYLESAGYNLSAQGHCLVADKLVFGSERDTRLVWASDRNWEEALLWNSILEARTNYPDARATVITPSRDGISKDTQQRLRQSRVRLLAPIQFFDSPFRVEESPRTASAIANIRQAAKSASRVPQPYRTDDHPSGARERNQDDLFHQLRQEMSTAGDATVRIIVGRAGIGKSCLFTSLFGDLYDDFLDSKNRLRSRPRPIPLLPEHLKQAQSMRTDALIENFLRTDVASPMTSTTFKWLLVNGYATWLLDGLDELYSGDPGFFDFILDLITEKGSRAQVTIWCRDSLLTTSHAFAEFQETCGGGDTLKIYKLTDWQRKQKRQFVWIQKKGRLPKPGDGDSAEGP